MPKRRACPCGTDTPYDACCGPVHDGSRAAATAEELMRSRYSAFAVGDAAYLLRSWHSATRPPRLDLDDDVTWTGLEVLRTDRGGAGDVDGIVEFRAHHRTREGSGVLHEVSRFRREDGAWRYVRGRPGDPRNDPRKLSTDRHTPRTQPDPGAPRV